MATGFQSINHLNFVKQTYIHCNDNQYINVFDFILYPIYILSIVAYYHGIIIIIENEKPRFENEANQTLNGMVTIPVNY